MVNRSALLSKYPQIIWFGPSLAVILALLAEYFMKTLLGGQPFLLLYPAISLGCLIGNRFSNIIATAIGALGAWGYFFPAEMSSEHILALAVFIVSGIVISIVSDLVIKGTESTTQLNEVLESMTDSFFSIDRDWRFTRVNKPYEEMGRIRRENRIGMSFRDVLIQKGLQNSLCWHEYHKVMQERVPVQFEEYYPSLNLWTECRGYPTSNGGMAVFFSDVTDRVLLRQDLERAKNEAEHANALKSAFLANMSHEIRTPLGAMIGFADLLRDPQITPEEHEQYVDILLRNGQQLSFIIDDVLDLSKIEAGHLTLEITKARPESIAADVVSLLSVKANDKNIKLELEIDPSLQATVATDAIRVRQVLLNLVGNAIKFTQVGSVKVRGMSGKTADGKSAFCFQIEDTGIGIPSDQVERIFGEFVQADGSITRKFGGTGLGLALSRKLARALGGEIAILRTESGKGTTFKACFEDFPESTISTRIERETKSNPQWIERSIQGLRILVVDDSLDNQQIIRHFLQNAGAIVATADNGAQGFEKASTGEFDLILMDLQMPEMDGYTATRKLRSAGFKRPIVALSAHAMTEVRDKCLEVGCTDYLPKPIHQPSLLATIARHLGST